MNDKNKIKEKRKGTKKKRKENKKMLIYNFSLWMTAGIYFTVDK